MICFIKGAPAAMYLAGAGIGILGIVDGDNVEESNLHRQIIHDTTRIGINKVYIYYLDFFKLHKKKFKEKLFFKILHI